MTLQANENEMFAQEIPIPEIKLFSSTNSGLNCPLATVNVPSPYKIISGGAAVSSGNGDLLVSSYPTNFSAANADGTFAPTRWTAWASGTRSANAEPATVMVYALAIADPDNKYNIRIFSNSSDGASEIPVPAGSVSVRSSKTRGGSTDLLWQ